MTKELIEYEEPIELLGRQITITIREYEKAVIELREHESKARIASLIGSILTIFSPITGGVILAELVRQLYLSRKHSKRLKSLDDQYKFTLEQVFSEDDSLV